MLGASCEEMGLGCPPRNLLILEAGGPLHVTENELCTASRLVIAELRITIAPG